VPDPDNQQTGANQANQEQQGGKLPGLPRLFFAEPQDQQGSDQPSGWPAGQDPSGAGLTGQPGQPGQYGQPGKPVLPIGQAGPGQVGRLWAAGRRPPQGQAGPGRTWSGKPTKPRPTRPPERELKQRAIASLTFGIMSMIAITFGFGPDPRRGVYLLLFSALVGIAAIVIGITAITKARRTGSYRPRGAIGGIGLGALAALVSISFLALYLAFPSQLTNYFNCVNQAQSSSQKQACLRQLEKSIQLGLRPAAGGAHQGRTSASPRIGHP